MKLCPRLATKEMLLAAQSAGAWTKDAKHANNATYEAMTTECPTVEVVDVEELKAPYKKDYENAGKADDQRGQSLASTKLRMIDKLTQNGYQIIKKI